MFLSVREMGLHKVCFDTTFAPGEIELFERKLQQSGPLCVTGTAELLPYTEDDIRVQGHLSVQMEVECDRCLDATVLPIESDFDLLYRPEASCTGGKEVEVDEDESEVGFYQGEGLELEEVLREDILLELPMHRLCREDCRGICTSCGVNRNHTSCDCQAPTVDDRWSVLRSYS